MKTLGELSEALMLLDVYEEWPTRHSPLVIRH
jgi:hypothetical protein